ncbi:hypothetical protein [uncultured Parvimonas sp.]|uniref:hypothetical protein n=1 Tax=uncultured Parvimonas sp. TaxID=747372 RepID=UPI00288AD778|nr:hypothetical protein [uncultured Parvimonas sp.]
MQINIIKVHLPFFFGLRCLQEDKNVDVEKVVATQMKIKNKKCINPYLLIRI